MHKKILKKVFAALLCLSVLAATTAVEPVQAEKMPSESVRDYINRCHNSIKDLSVLDPSPKVIAYAYLAGEDGVVTGYATHEMYAVDPDTEIQGVKYDSKYYPQDNKEYLKDIRKNYGSFGASGKIYSMSEDAQYIEQEGCKFKVVACDEKWVTVWDRGYQSWYASGGLATAPGYLDEPVDTYLKTHPAGFYKIQRSKVWLDFGLKANHPYQSADEIPKAGSGIVTKQVYLRPVPNEEEKQYTPVYVLLKGTKVNVVSTEPVPSKALGSTRKYYKVSFNGSEKMQNNTVGYLRYKVPGVYYVDSRCLNVTQAGAELPQDAAHGKVVNVKKGETVYVYPSRDTSSECIGILSTGVEIDMLPAESDAEWITVYFSGQKAYVQAKYIKRIPYKVTKISKLRIADIVNDEIKMCWNVGKNNIEYSCSVATKKGKVLWSMEHCKTNSFVINRKYIEGKYTALDVRVQATDRNGNKGKALLTRISLPLRAFKLDKKKYVIGKTKIKGKYRSHIFGFSAQYSTNKKFKNAVTIERYYKKGSTSGYKPVSVIKKLKPNTTYYIRRRIKKEYRTVAGTKWLSGRWSKYMKIKTKA